MAFIHSTPSPLFTPSTVHTVFRSSLFPPLRVSSRSCTKSQCLSTVLPFSMSTSASPASEKKPGGPVRSTVADTPQKQFLERLKALGRVRIVVRNPVGILETVGTFDSLFYATIPSGEYANVIDHKLNLDMHILLSGFTGVKFEIGKARSKVPAQLYSLRLLGENRETPAVSVFVMWEKDPTDVEPERIQAWKDLKSDYIKPKPDGTDEDDTFFFDQL